MQYTHVWSELDNVKQNTLQQPFIALQNLKTCYTFILLIVGLETIFISHIVSINQLNK